MTEKSNDITNLVPEHLRDVVFPGEMVRHFAWTDLNSESGCGGGAQAKQYVMISDKRVIYDASLKNDKGYRQSSGSIAIDKVSFVSVNTATQSEGCNQEKVSILEIKSGGGGIELAVPTELEAKRLQRIINELQVG